MQRGHLASSRRNDAIDALRGIAILGVIAFHYLVHYAPPESPRDLVGFDYTYSPWLSLGQYGVHVFFVVSGLVIAMTVSRSDGALDFTVRRLARLYPALVVAAPLTFLVARVGPPEFHRTVSDLFASLTFFAHKLHRHNVDGVYWSLTVEVTFYAVIAASVLVLRTRFWIGPLVLGIATGVAEIIGYPMILAAYWPYFLAGIGGWYLLFDERRRLGLTFLAIAVLLYVGWLRPGGLPVDLAIIVPVAATFSLIAIGYQGPYLGLAWLGRRSYSLYLIHNIIGVTLIAKLSPFLPDAVVVVGVLALMVALASLMFKHVEEPGKDLLLGIWRRRRPGTRAPRDHQT
ncbi:MAG: acyltransferase [Kofleriaceae bacterium]|nr:acyltransferase [Kofleriaceae bacterium]